MDRETMLKMKRAVVEDGTRLCFVPEEMKTEQMCLDAVQSNGTALKDVPEKLRTRQMCLEAVDGAGSEDLARIMPHVPAAAADAAFYKAAVERNPAVFGFAPESFRTKELCRLAVALDGTAVRGVPEALREPSMCAEIVRQMKLAPSYRRSMELFRAACDALPEDMRSADLYREAVLVKPDLRVFVPECFRGEVAELFFSRFKFTEEEKAHMPGWFGRERPPFKTPRNETDALAVVKACPENLRGIAEHLRTPKVAMAAFPLDAECGDPSLLNDVPMASRTPDVCRAAVRVNGRSLRCVPMCVMNYETCRDAVTERHSGNERPGAADERDFALRWVPAAYMDAELCMAAVKADGMQLSCAPDEFMTEALCLAACAENGHALRFVPERLKTEAVCEAALQSADWDGETLRAVPAALKAELEERRESAPRPGA